MIRKFLITSGVIVAGLAPVTLSISCSNDAGYLIAYVDIDTSKYVRGDKYAFNNAVNKATADLDGTISKGIKYILRVDGKQFGNELELGRNSFETAISGTQRIKISSEGNQHIDAWQDDMFNQLNETLPLPTLPMNSSKQTISYRSVNIFAPYSNSVKPNLTTFITDNGNDWEINDLTSAPTTAEIRHMEVNRNGAGWIYPTSQNNIPTDSYVRLLRPGSTILSSQSSSLIIDADNENKVIDFNFGELVDPNLDIIPCATDEIVGLVFDNEGNYIGHVLLTEANLPAILQTP